MKRSFYSDTVSTFLSTSTDAIVGQLAQSHSQHLVQQQTGAWLEQIQILKDQLLELPDDAFLFFEFVIPRMGKRVDCVLVVQGIIFVLEFKVGASSYLYADRQQAEGYALDLKHFHQGSHDKSIVPILVATRAKDSFSNFTFDSEQVSTVVCLPPYSLSAFFTDTIFRLKCSPFDAVAWSLTAYQPTPTIVEAAQALYAKHSVVDISRSEAGVENLHDTSKALFDLIHLARREHRKIICFVTGVPGAGKTLVGLNIANQHSNHEDLEYSVFLSGNGPLVAVLQEALARDQNQSDPQIKMAEARQRTRSFIQNIHKFRDEYLKDLTPPAEHVVIFDEAQRAWDLKQTANFMQQKRGISDFSMSEPEFLISVMARHQDWAVVIALIGGGQEINTGEAGISGWFDAVLNSKENWDAYCSPKLLQGEYVRDELTMESISKFKQLPPLHLATSMRSFRAEKLSDFVHHLIDMDSVQASVVLQSFKDRFEVVMTRDLDTAKKWVSQRTKGGRRSGLLASSNGIRLKAEGIFVKNQIEPENWFLAPGDDIRSSLFLEDAATEFDVQGLELDWALVAWDADLRMVNGSFEHWRFSGTRWQKRSKKDSQKYLENAYRVLLTRAREGMIIFVPRGDADDATRLPEYYKGIADYLAACGIAMIES